MGGCVCGFCVGRWMSGWVTAVDKHLEALRAQEQRRVAACACAPMHACARVCGSLSKSCLVLLSKHLEGAWLAPCRGLRKGTWKGGSWWWATRCWTAHM